MKKILYPLSLNGALKPTYAGVPAMLAAGLFVGMFSARTVVAQTVTSNLHEHIEIIKASTSGTVSFTLAPEDPKGLTPMRAHWPIVFIDYENDGNNIRQMYNLTEERTFSVNVTAAQGGSIKITGEDGTWKLVCTNQNIKDVKLEHATTLRYVDLSKNVLGTANASSDFSLDPANNKIETLNVSENKLKTIGFGAATGTLKELYANDNLIASANLSSLTALSVVDYSKNLLTQFTAPTAFNDNWSVFKGSTSTSVYAGTVSGPSTPLYASKTLANDGMLNLTINKLNIASLPTLPTALPADKYYYTLQERYTLPLSPRSDTEFRPLEEIDISDQLTATGVAGSAKTTQYRWYREINPGTDQYVEIPSNEYKIVGGKTKFLRGYGNNAKIFAAMTTDAFGNSGKPLESYERGTGSITTSGFDEVLVQPAGTSASALQFSYFNDVKAGTANTIGDGLDSRALNARFFRTNTITLNASHNNFWYGYKSNDWADADNWTGRFVPNTLTAVYNDDNRSDVFFASSAVPAGQTISFGESAIRDLHTDQDRVVRNYINNSELGHAMVATPGKQIVIKKKVTVAAATATPYSTAPDLSYRLLLKAEDNQPNASLFVETPSQNPNLAATVELYSKANDGNRNKQVAVWQYFGVPVANQKLENVVPANTWVRKYNRALDLPNTDEKWEDVAHNVVLNQGQGYEITQPKPATYRFYGGIYMANFTFPIDGVATVTPPPGSPSVNNYKDMNILANPYTAAMKINKIDFSAAPSADKVVYLFNTGSRKDWMTNNGAITPGNSAGQYTQAIPIGLVGHVAGMPEEIPTLSTFMVKSTAAGSLSYAYQNLAKVTEKNKTPQKRYHSLSIDVTSDKSADRMWLVEAEGATDQFDNGYDGEKIFTAGEAQIYAMQDRSYQISTTNEIGETKVGFVPGDGLGNYKLTFHIDEADKGQEYYLVDLRSGVRREIEDGLTYDFTAKAGEPLHRFTILGKNSSKINQDQRGFEISVDAQRNITVRNYTEEAATVQVFDAAGKVQARFQVEADGKNSGQVVMPGVYVVRVANKVTTATQRYVIP